MREDYEEGHSGCGTGIGIALARRSVQGAAPPPPRFDTGTPSPVDPERSSQPLGVGVRHLSTGRRTMIEP